MSGYLARVEAQTSSRFWVNNPTLDDAAKAIDAGAVGSTTNPAFMASILRRAPDEITPRIRDRVASGLDDHAVADQVQLDLVSRIAETFDDIHRASSGRLGMVSIQGAPTTDHDAAIILHEALEARRARPNVVPKIPATAEGLTVLGELAGRGEPCIVTEVFSVDQLIAVCERHARANGARDPSLLFISPITGIFGDHLRAVATAQEIEVPAAAIARAGVVLSRACQRIVDARGYAVTLLAGGARSTLDFTDLIGGGMHLTINYSTAQELEELDPPIVETIATPDDVTVVRSLTNAFDSVRIALEPGSLALEDFGSFPPVLFFRGVFVEGWDATLDAIAKERASTTAIRTA